MSLQVKEIARCLHGIIPSAIATADAQGVPNVSYVSHVELVDDKHVALSCQFFNKTKRNVTENPKACLQVSDPLDFSAYRLDLVYRRSETEGPLYERMTSRIEAIAAHTGMKGVFRLLSSDIYEVRSVTPIEDFLMPIRDELLSRSGPDPHGPMTELRGLQLVSHTINGACRFDELVEGALSALEEAFDFEHSMLMLLDETGERLFAVGSRGYGRKGIGAEVRVGDGFIGACAEQRRVLSSVGMGADLRYARAVRNSAHGLGQTEVRAEVPLPGLPDAQSQMALPLCIGERLLGVLAVESSHPLRFENWHEAFLGLVGNQLALALDRLGSSEDRELEPASSEEEHPETESRPGLRFCYFAQDDSVFVDGEYLVRGLPGRILFKLLRDSRKAQHQEFTNRELRLDPFLGLPAVKDNLESRLLLLRRRLEEKCPTVRLVPVKRGRFALEFDSEFLLEERTVP